MAATPDKSNITTINGQPNTAELIEGPPCECGKCPPHTIFGFTLQVDPEHIQRIAEKAEALAVLHDTELPEDFTEMLEQLTEEVSQGDTHAVIDTYDICWN